jgi:hypothetical protein
VKRERPTQRRIDELEAEVDELREVLKDLLFLKQMDDDGESGGWPRYRLRLREAWQAARDLMGEEG